MAHKISIPVQFECVIERSYWTVGKASVLRWWLTYGGWGVEIRLTSPAYRTRHKPSLRTQDLPKEVSILLPPEGEKLRGPIKSAEFDVLVGTERLRSGKRSFDPWQLRSDFLSLNPSIDAACDFLNRYGAWNRGWHPRDEIEGSDMYLAVRTPFEIWQYQHECREALANGANRWFSSHQAPSNFHARETFPHFIHTDSTCEEAINTSITVDFLREVRFALCPRSDCNKPFALEHKGKIYCSQYCAHLVSVRKSRTKSSSVPSPK